METEFFSYCSHLLYNNPLTVPLVEKHHLRLLLAPKSVEKSWLEYQRMMSVRDSTNDNTLIETPKETDLFVQSQWTLQFKSLH